MDGADAGAGEHGDEGLRDHGHVEDDAVALADAKPGEHEGAGLHVLKQLGIGDGAFDAGDGTVVDDSGQVAAPIVDVAVEGVVADVAGAIGEPAAVGA